MLIASEAISHREKSGPDKEPLIWGEYDLERQVRWVRVGERYVYAHSGRGSEGMELCSGNTVGLENAFGLERDGESALWEF